MIGRLSGFDPRTEMAPLAPTSVSRPTRKVETAWVTAPKEVTVTTQTHRGPAASPLEDAHPSTNEAEPLWTTLDTRSCMEPRCALSRESR